MADIFLFRTIIPGVTKFQLECLIKMSVDYQIKLHSHRPVSLWWWPSFSPDVSYHKCETYHGLSSAGRVGACTKVFFLWKYPDFEMTYSSDFRYTLVTIYDFLTMVFGEKFTHCWIHFYKNTCLRLMADGETLCLPRHHQAGQMTQHRRQSHCTAGRADDQMF